MGTPAHRPQGRSHPRAHPTDWGMAPPAGPAAGHLAGPGPAVNQVGASPGHCVAGVDGCRAGWIVLCRCGNEPVQAWLEPTASALVTTLRARTPRPQQVLIDIPIGLPSAGRRRCDQLARVRLAQRRSSVFPAPIRPMLAADSWEEACRIGADLEGRRLSRQAWNITARVREVDGLLQQSPALRGWMREVHPELSFLAMAGAPLPHAKKTAAGRNQRLKLIGAAFGGDAFASLRDRFRRGAVADDDLLDAFAALWSSERLLRGEALVLPPTPEWDATGLAMEIVS
jgi:predicted RNase H-like nuclease